MICNFCWLLGIRFAGALTAENEPTAGGSSLSRFQPLLGSQARVSGHINSFLPPGFVLYFCRRLLTLLERFSTRLQRKLGTGQPLVMPGMPSTQHWIHAAGLIERLPVWLQRTVMFQEAWVEWRQKGQIIFCQSLEYYRSTLNYMWWSEWLMQTSKARL